MRPLSRRFLLSALALLIALPETAGSQPASGAKGAPSPEGWKTNEPAPVEFDGQTLFYVRVGVADLTPQVRAQGIEARLEAIARAGPPAPVRVEEGQFSNIYAGDRFVMSITDEDAGTSGPARATWARYVAQEIEGVLKQHWEERAPPALLRAAVKSAIATAVLLAFLVALRLAGKRVGPRLRRAAAAFLSRARIQAFEVLKPASQERLIRAGGRTLYAGLVAIALFTWFEVVAHLLPWTRQPAQHTLRFLAGASGSVALKVLHFLPNLVYILLLSLVGYGANRVNRVFFQAVARGAIRLPNFYPDWSVSTSRLVSVFIYALLAVAIYPYLPGSGSSAFQAIGIFFGAMISLGSGSSVANAISGVLLTYMRPFAVGDFVRIANTTGTVQSQSMLAVHVLSIRNEHVTIPASMVLSGQIVNFSTHARADGVAIATRVTIGYDTPWRQVHDLLLAAAEKTPHVKAAPKPWVIQAELTDFYVAYELDVYIDDPSRQHFILSELNQNVQDAFFRAGVEILSPHFSQLRDGAKPAIPDEWLPPGSREKAFRVSATVREAREAPAPAAAPAPGEVPSPGRRGGES